MLLDEMVSMSKSKELEEIDRERSKVYEACMQAYRWMSQRYRKTLDALAK
jgi:hypothetical protein